MKKYQKNLEAFTASLTNREDALRELSIGSFDVLVIGGGISGAGIALVCALAGKRTALIEQRDFGSATSSRSSKLVHGGIRYLSQLDLPMVMEGVRERGRLLRLFPSLVEPMPFLLPLYEGLKRPLGMPSFIPRSLRGLSLRIGLRCYEALSMGTKTKKHAALRPEQAFAMAPFLKRDGFERALLYYDAQADDVALTLAALRAAHRHGAVIANHLRANRFLTDSGKVVGVEACNELTKKSLEVRATHVVNASGVFAGNLAALDPHSDVHLLPSKGIHLVLSPSKLPLPNVSVVLPETSDGRIAFLIPWMGKVLLGTTDSPYEGDLSEPMATKEEVRGLLFEAQRFLGVKIERPDILGHFAGLRPLVFEASKIQGAVSSKLSRKHKIYRSPSGLTHVLGGKLTTFLLMGLDTFRALFPEQKPPDLNTPIEPSPTAKELNTQGLPLTAGSVQTLTRLYGADTPKLFEILAESPGLAAPLLDGTRPILAEALYHIRYGMAVDLRELLETRLRLAWVMPDHGVGVLDAVMDLLQKELHISTQELQDQASAYRNYAARMDAILEGV